MQIGKSLSQRQKAKLKYDQTIEEAEKKYQELVLSSGVLMDTVALNADVLPQSMDKKIGTSIDEDITTEDLLPQEKGKRSKSKKRSKSGPDRNKDSSNTTTTESDKTGSSKTTSGDSNTIDGKSAGTGTFALNGSKNQLEESSGTFSLGYVKKAFSIIASIKYVF